MKTSKAPSLLLITNHFPFGKGESFLETEVEYLIKEFGRIIVLARTQEKSQERKVNGIQTFWINPVSSITEKVYGIALLVKNFRLALSRLSEERHYLKSRKKRINMTIAKRMLHDLFKAIITAHHIRKIINKEKPGDTIILYSYWLNTSALALTLLKEKKIRLIKLARAHGGDLYEENHPSQYLSFRYSMAMHLHRIFAISKTGRLYLQQRLSKDLNDKIVTSRLGTKPASRRQSFDDKCFTVVSCSFLNPGKRIHLIIEALAVLSRPIRWIHIGDGPLRDLLTQLANERLKGQKNVEIIWKGFMPNQSILELYSMTSIDLFISVSATEGIPVSMMEAQSFGIPILATDVGGVKEIVSPAVGKLLPPDIDARELAREIKAIMDISEVDHQQLSKNSFENWKEHYNAEKNYSSFVGNVKALSYEI